MIYAPACKKYDDWIMDSLFRPQYFSRKTIAHHIREIKKDHGNKEAKQFLSYIIYLGTYPVMNSARWKNKYGEIT